MSPTHSRFSLATAKLRCTRSDAGRATRLAYSPAVVPAPACPLQACRLHQACHPHPTHTHALIGKFSEDTVHTIGASRTKMDPPDAISQDCIFSRARRRCTIQPCIGSDGGDFQHAAHGGHGINCLMHSHELEDPGGIELICLANQPATIGRISSSSHSRLFSRRKRASSSRSEVVVPPCRRP